MMSSQIHDLPSGRTYKAHKYFTVPYVIGLFPKQIYLAGRVTGRPSVWRFVTVLPREPNSSEHSYRSLRNNCLVSRALPSEAVLKPQVHYPYSLTFLLILNTTNKITDYPKT
jgi:hypothetical protein